jgi:hypothetical protein
MRNRGLRNIISEANVSSMLYPISRNLLAAAFVPSPPDYIAHNVTTAGTERKANGRPYAKMQSDWRLYNMRPKPSPAMFTAIEVAIPNILSHSACLRCRTKQRRSSSSGRHSERSPGRRNLSYSASDSLSSAETSFDCILMDFDGLEKSSVCSVAQ